MSALLLPLVLVAAQGAAAPAPLDPSAKSRRGTELMAAGRYAEAVSLYRELVQALPDNPGLLVDLGMALHLAGKERDAIAPLEAALRLQPDSFPAALFLGDAHLALGQAAAALVPLQKAVHLRPADPSARSLLAEALLRLGHHAAAEPHLRRLSQLSPSDPAPWFNLGKACEALAGKAFEDLLARDPESAFALALVAEARLRQEQLGAAFHLYRLALQRAPSLRGLHAAVAGIYRRAGHPDWAAVEEGREAALPRADCARETLECAFAAGRYHEVVAGAAAAKTAAAAYWLVRAWNELATQAFGRLAALPPSVQSHEWMAEVHRSQRRYAESAGEWRQALALASGDPRLMTELAITLRLAGDLPAAQDLLEQVLRATPDGAQPNYLLGDVLLGRGEPERAAGYLEKAVRLEPTAQEAQGALGRAYALTGRPADAIIHLRQALPADVDGSLRLQLARAYQATGQAEEARRALAEYEEFQKAAQAESESAGAGAALTPPDGPVR